MHEGYALCAWDRRRRRFVASFMEAIRAVDEAVPVE
jgi:hypothetical protein